MTQWISVSEYAKKTGQSQQEVRRLIKEKLIEAIPSEGGGKFFVKVEVNEDVYKLTAEVKELSQKVDMLLNHLGVRQPIENETGRKHVLIPRNM